MWTTDGHIPRHWFRDHAYALSKIRNRSAGG